MEARRQEATKEQLPFRPTCGPPFGADTVQSRIRPRGSRLGADQALWGSLQHPWQTSAHSLALGAGSPGFKPRLSPQTLAFPLLLGSVVSGLPRKPFEPRNAQDPLNAGSPLAPQADKGSHCARAEKGNCLFPRVSLLRCQPTGLQYGMTKVFFSRGCDPCTENKQNNTRRRG